MTHMPKLLSAALVLSFAGAIAASAADKAIELGRIKVKSLEEISGIAASRLNAGTFWMHNDGEAKRIYAVTSTGKVIAQLSLPNAITDLEDIAIGASASADQDYIYLGDIGDNDRDRREVQVVRIIEPALKGGSQFQAESVEALRLRYPDDAHDAEALLIDPVSGDVVIVTKEEDGARVYTASGGGFDGGGQAELELIAKLDANQISAGDISRDGSQVALRRENRGWLWQRSTGESLAAALARRPMEIRVRDRRQGENGESLAFAADGGSYFTISEGKNERLFEFRVGGDGDKSED
jgi:hypothetical protein